MTARESLAALDREIATARRAERKASDALVKADAVVQSAERAIKDARLRHVCFRLRKTAPIPLDHLGWRRGMLGVQVIAPGWGRRGGALWVWGWYSKCHHSLA